MPTRYLAWIDGNLISTLQDRHRTHAATLRGGKAQKSLIAGRLQRMVERRGLEPFKGCGPMLSRLIDTAYSDIKARVENG